MSRENSSLMDTPSCQEMGSEDLSKRNNDQKSANNNTQLPTLDPYEGPPLNECEDTHPESLQGASKAASSQKGLLARVTSLSTSTSKAKQEKIRFVAAGILDQDLEGKTPIEIYNILHDEYDPKEPADEFSPTHAATIFKEVLQSAGIHETQTETLNKFCEKDSPPKKLSDKLNLRQEFLKLGDQIPEEKDVQRLANGEFAKELEGTAIEDIRTPISLFQHLLRKPGVISATSSESVERFKDRWAKATEQTDFPSKSTQHSVPGHTDIIVRGERNDDEPDQQTHCCVRHKCTVITGTVIIILVMLASIALMSHFGVLSTKSLSQQISLYRNTTIFFAREPLNILFTVGLYFQLKLLPDTKVEICHLDCTNRSPSTRSVSFHYSDNSTSNQYPPSNEIRRHVRFSNIGNFDYQNIYLLGDSSLVFSVNGDTRGVPISLHIFDNVSRCVYFLTGSNETHKVFTLNESNSFTANFTIPSGGPDSYYCGVWEVPPSLSDVTFEYSISGRQVVYDVDRSIAQCVDPLPNTTERVTCLDDSGGECVAYTLLFKRSYVERYMCVLLSQLNQDSEVNALRVQSFSTFWNPPFLSSPVVLVLFGGIVLIVILCVICIRKKLANNNTTAH